MTLRERYLARLGLDDAGAPSLETLRRLHRAHLEAIPFENLDILLGQAVRLDLDSLQDKLLTRGRGGYWFEQNSLFLAVLRDLGFAATPVEARVRLGSERVTPRTHLAVQVVIEGIPWLADVGFGSLGLLEPIAMTGGEHARAMGIAHRVVDQDGDVVLQARQVGDETWRDEYQCLRTEVHPADLEVANWYTSTHPGSPFVRRLTAQRVTPGARCVLRYPQLIVVDGEGSRTHEIARQELMPLLATRFGIDLPANTTFAAIDG